MGGPEPQQSKQPPPLSPQLQSVSAGLPPMEAYQAGADDDFDVFEGEEDVPIPAAGFKTQGRFNKADKKKKGSEYYKDFHRKNPGELGPLQKRLYLGGFYDRSMDWDDIRTADWDPETEQAWKRAVDRAGAVYDAGEKLTLDEVIDRSIRSRQESGAIGKDGRPTRGSGSGSGRGSKPPPISVTVTHPDDIRTTAMKISSQTLGRGWGVEELDRFVLTYQQMERAAQSASQRANYAGGASTAAPDVGVAAERAARASNPAAAEGVDMVGAYGSIMKAIQNLGGK